MANKVYEVGYNAPGAEEYVDSLMMQPQMLLIDTRFSPKSRLSEWREGALRAKYGTRRYRWAGEYLGNINYQGGPIELAQPDLGIACLISMLDKGFDLILLCQCPNFLSCHRYVIIKKLKEYLPDVSLVLQPVIAASETVKCLTLWAPWWYFIIHGFKDIENRPWSTAHRGLTAFHAGQTFDPLWLNPDGSLRSSLLRRYGLVGKVPTHRSEYVAGAIVGSAQLTDVVMRSDSPWFCGKYGFVFEDAHPLAETVPYKGQMKLFNVPRSVLG